jgi:hypothetical protein
LNEERNPTHESNNLTSMIETLFSDIRNKKTEIISFKEENDSEKVTFSTDNNRDTLFVPEETTTTKAKTKTKITTPLTSTLITTEYIPSNLGQQLGILEDENNKNALISETFSFNSLSKQYAPSTLPEYVLRKTQIPSSISIHTSTHPHIHIHTYPLSLSQFTYGFSLYHSLSFLSFFNNDKIKRAFLSDEREFCMNEHRLET